jgi:hypothetical protein
MVKSELHWVTWTNYRIPVYLYFLLPIFEGGTRSEDSIWNAMSVKKRKNLQKEAVGALGKLFVCPKPEFINPKAVSVSFINCSSHWNSAQSSKFSPLSTSLPTSSK